MKYRSLKGWKYALLEDETVIVDITDDVFIITDYVTLASGYLMCKSCYAWDGASFIARDTPNIMRASLFHDALTQLIGEGLLDREYRKYVDDLFRQHCLEDGMSKFRAWYVWVAVRAYSKWKGM